MPYLLALLVLAAPVVEVESVEKAPLLTFSGTLAYSGGMAPGNSMGWMLGVRHTRGRFSLGLEFQFLSPGSHTISNRETTQFLRIGNGEEYVISTRGFGIVGNVPVCIYQGVFSACGVVAAGAVQTTKWEPLLSAGIRGSAEYPQHNPIRLRADAQVLAGILRPEAGYWKASPIQLGFSVGAVFDI
jgi:hypothetical protein